MSKFAVNFEDNELLNALRLLKEQKYFTDRKIATLSGHKSGQSVYYWRRSKSQPSPEERWRIIQAAKLTDAITRRVSAEYVPLFFAHPFELLGGKTPLQVLPADTHKDVLDETVQCFAELVQADGPLKKPNLPKEWSVPIHCQSGSATLPKLLMH